MNKNSNKQAICDVLVERAAQDRDIVVLCSDSRGSASMTEFSERYPEQFVETGIAEQNIVSIAAGLARCGKKAYVASPACFLSSRALEQLKVDVAYSGTNVKLIGVSGGISYGALGLTHHSTSDIAAVASLPRMRVYIPSDSRQSENLIRDLLLDDMPAYVRVGRNPVPGIYTHEDRFEFNKATQLHPGNDITIIACGEMVKSSMEAALELKNKGISCRVLDMYCIKPLDREAVIRAAMETKGIITIEEHNKLLGLGALVAEVVCAEHPCKVIALALPDEPVVAGKSQEVFEHYGLNSQNLVQQALRLVDA